MELGYFAKRTFLPMILEWVEQSRLRKSLPQHPCDFIVEEGDCFLSINLSYLNKDYLSKHVEKDMQKYCDEFTIQLRSVVRAWCLRCNLHQASVSIKFKGMTIIYSTINLELTFAELNQNRK